MSQSQDKNNITQMAELARIQLTASEKKTFPEQFEKILAYFNELQKVPSPPSKEVDQNAKAKLLNTSTMRADKEGEQGLTRVEVLKNAPRSNDKCFLTPPIIE